MDVRIWCCPVADRGSRERSCLVTADATSADQEAITATVTGAMIQKVGFRAMIQKEAIKYDLAGSDKMRMLHIFSS